MSYQYQLQKLETRMAQYVFVVNAFTLFLVDTLGGLGLIGTGVYLIFS